MSLWETLRVALEALSANKMRSILTMLGIIIGVGSVIAIFAIGKGTSAAVQGELKGLASGQIMLRAGRAGPGGAVQRIAYFTEEDMQDIENLLPDVEAVVTTINVPAVVKYERESVNSMMSGHYAKAQAAFDIRIADGRWFTKEEEQSGARVVVLGNGAAKRLMGEGVNPVGKVVSINGVSFDVIGVTEAPTGLLASLAGAEDASLYVPLGTARRMANITQQLYNTIFIKARNGADTKQVMADAIAIAERNHKGAQFSGESFDQFVGVVSTVLNIVTGVLSAVAGISLVVGGVGIMNIMLVSVTERTREIGIRKAIGASYRDILVQFLIEAVLLSVIGGVIGIALAAIPVMLVGRFLKISLLLDATSVLLALGFSVAVGIIFGVYPASKAARLDPIEALRYE
jgi:putative ABC transport system permease protein